MATKKGRIHDVFQKLVDSLRTAAKETADAFCGKGQRTWGIPAGMEEVDLSKVADLHKPAFDRSDMNANYEECLASAADAGTAGDATGLKTQIDYVAMQEQAFRLQHASQVRCFVHGHARLFGQGQPKSVFDEVARQATDQIAAGAVGAGAPQIAASTQGINRGITGVEGIA